MLEEDELKIVKLLLKTEITGIENDLENDVLEESDRQELKLYKGKLNQIYEKLGG